MITQNTIRAANGTEIYENRILEAFDDYLDNLCDDPQEARQYIRRPLVFRGAIKHIYKLVFKPSPTNPPRGTAARRSYGTVLDTSDVETLSNIYQTFSELCYKYDQTPTTHNFAMLTGISYTTLLDWRNGKVGSESHNNLSKDIYKDTEGGYLDSASKGNIGSIFLLKSIYNYSETAPRQETPDRAKIDVLSDDEIEELANNVKPTLRDLTYRHSSDAD